MAKEEIKSNDKLDYEIVNDKAIDAIKDNFTPPGAKNKKRKIRARDDHSLVWDNEDIARRFIATPLLYGNFKDSPEDTKAYYKELKKMPIEELVKHRDTADSWEFVPEEDEDNAEVGNWTMRTLYPDGSPFGNDLEDALDEWDKEDVKDTIDTNDNGEIEVDEMADFQKSLDDYASKNKKGRDDIPVTTRR